MGPWRSILSGALLVIAIVGSTFGTAHAEARPHYGGSVEAALLGAPASFDPVAAHTHAETTIAGLVFDTLYRAGADGVIQPDLAVGVPVLDEKQTTVRIAIRKGVRFHDGTALTPSDVVQSLERVHASTKWLLAPVSAIRVDGDAVELTLRAPVADLMALLAMPQTAVTKKGRPPGERPVGSGPYVLKTIKKTLVELRAFDDYFAGRAYLDDITLRWYDTADGEARRFETGNAQFSARGVTAFANAKPTFVADAKQSPVALLVYLGFGRAHADVTGSAAFRRAVDFAIGRDTFSRVGSGELVVPTRSPVPAESGGAELDAAGRTGDLDKARAQLANLPTRKLELLIEDTRPDDREIAERVIVALGKVGIVATITAVPSKDLAERIAKGTSDLWIGQLAAPLTPSSMWWGAAFAAGNDDWPVAQLADGAVDPQKAAAAFADRMPIVPLLFRAVQLWHRTDIRGVGFDRSGRPCFADMFFFGMPAKSKP
ncbi:MAG: extracellular solute-binding protein family 5 [Myxococcales bacterium]|nr:extracellular solute-binding protein family 5 [Myxococcales bacterium]